MDSKNVIRRIIAYIIDWNIIIIIGFLISLIGPRFDVNYLITPSINMFSSYGIILSVLFYIFAPLFKDIIFGYRSFGKLLCKLNIYSEDDKPIKNIGLLMLRNITFYFGVIDLVVLLVNKKSLGDLITNTCVHTKL